MLRLQGLLDRLSERLGVAKLSEFVDGSDLAADFLDWLQQDSEEGLIPADQVLRGGTGGRGGRESAIPLSTRVVGLHAA